MFTSTFSLAAVFYEYCTTVVENTGESNAISADILLRLLSKINHIERGDGDHGELARSRLQVAYSAKLQTAVPYSQRYGIVIFDEPTVNVGNAYNLKTGIFTCPVTGLYLFTCNILSDHGVTTSLWFWHNGVLLMRPRTGRHENEPSPGSDSAIIKCKFGERVYAKRFETNIPAGLDHMSRFSAVLLKAD